MLNMNNAIDEDFREPKGPDPHPKYYTSFNLVTQSEISKNRFKRNMVNRQRQLRDCLEKKLDEENPP